MQRVLFLFLATAFVTLATVDAAAAPARVAGERYALETLDAMVESGEIDEGQRGLYLLTLLHDPALLPADLRLPIEPDIPCLTTQVLQAWRDVSQAGPAIREAAGRLLGDPPETVGYLESDLLPVRVYYQSEEDMSAVRVVLDAAERGWEAQVEELGWTPPTGEEEGAPVERLDIYFVETDGYGGYCEALGNNDATSWTDALIRCEVARTSDTMGLAETVIHEMHHALQYSEDACEFMSAFEMFCVHTINTLIPDNWEWDYFLPHFQADPEYAIFLMSSSNRYYHYGTALFAQYLDERFGEGDASLAPRLWRAARQDGVIIIDGYWVYTPSGNDPDLFDAIDSYLASEHGSSLEEALVEFAEWRLVLGANDDGEHFARGGRWLGAEPTMGQSFDPNELPVIEEPAATPPMPTGTSYVEIRTDALEGAAQLRFSVNLGTSVRWAAQVIRLMGSEPAEVTRLEVSEEGLAGAVIPAVGAEAVVLAVTNLGDEHMDPDDWPVFPSEFSYTIEILTQPEVTAISPAAATAGMTDVEVVVEASPLDPEATLDLGPGITVRVAQVDRGSLTARIDIAGDAEIGPHDVTVTNPGSDPGVLEGGFEVLAPPGPSLASVSPQELEPGTVEVLTVTGSGILEGAVASLGAGITVESADVVDGTEMLLAVRVSESAAPGPRALNVTNPGGNASTLADAVVILDLGEEAGGGCACRGAGGAAPARGSLLVATLLGLALAGLRRR